MPIRTTVSHALRFLTASAAAGVLAAGAFPALASGAPPSGTVVLDLDGQPIPHEFALFTAQFVATSAFTDIAFAFRDDPARLILDDVAVTPAEGSNVLRNGDFEGGSGSGSQPADWTYSQLDCLGGCGFLAAGLGRGGSAGYFDGASDAYDEISQTIHTHVGLTYQISFRLNEQSGLTTFHRDPTNPGQATAVDLVVFANPSTAGGAPEPAAWALMIGGFGLAGQALRRRKSAA